MFVCVTEEWVKSKTQIFCFVGFLLSEKGIKKPGLSNDYHQRERG